MNVVKSDVGINNIIEIAEESLCSGTITIDIEGHNNSVIIKRGIYVADTLNIIIRDDGNRVVIGDNCTFESTIISVADNNVNVSIGEDCMFAAGTKILASDFHSILDLNDGRRINDASDVLIGAHVWIAGEVMILKNVTIGDNVVIGARSVVIRDICRDCVVAGYPAKVVRENITWLRQRVKSPSEDLQRKICVLPISENKVYGFIDTYDKATYAIMGWAFMDGEESRNTDFFAEIEHHGVKERIILPGHSIYRPDVAKQYGDLYSYSGFQVTVDFRKSPVKSMAIHLINGDKHGVYYVSD